MSDIAPTEAEPNQGDVQVGDIVLNAPIDLSNPKYSTKSDIVDALEEAPSLPPKTGDIPPSPRRKPRPQRDEEVIRDAGSVILEDYRNEVPEDREVTLDEILKKPEEQGIDSESVKAFFSKSDTVDARMEKKETPTFEYDMKHKKRGCFLIFNQKHFLPKLYMTTRNGTNMDALNLKNTAKKLGFEYVRVFDDLDAKDIFSWIEDVATADHSDYDCFACAILTHGEEGDILYAHDDTFPVSRLTEPFEAKHCPSLAGKPKLFFIQACRGQKLDQGMRLGDMVDAKQIAFKGSYNIIPNTSDFLLAYSTVQGYYAWRNQSSGSWFVQALCKCLQEYGSQLEMMQIMTRVNRMVAYDFISYSRQNKEFHEKKQIPSIVTRLTHELYFRKKEIDYGVKKKDHGKRPSKTFDVRNSSPSGPTNPEGNKELVETNL